MPVPCSEIIEDIEDLVDSLDLAPKERYSSRKHVKARPRKKQEVPEPVELCTSGNIVPGTQTVYIKTWGCAHNSSDSEYMAGQLAGYGYTLTQEPLSADLWLLNSCTVKGPAEDHFRNEVERGLRLGKHIVTAGCVPQAAPRSSYLRGLSAIGVQNIDRVVEVVEETLKGHSVRLFGQKKSHGKKLGGADLILPKVRKNRFVEIIAISTGCLNQCTYCKTKHARGELGSYPPQDIIQRAVQAFSEGVVEIWLTSEDTGAYGRDIGETLPGLLRGLLEVIPPYGRLRLGMTNPPYILEHLEAMAAVLNDARVYKFLHVPVQSGSDQVLSDMKREYNVQEFIHVVTFLRERVPGITIATDIICAFPTETEADFEQTMTLCRDYQFPSLFINQFYPRPGTPAARLPRVPAQEAKRRTRVLAQLFQSYETYGLYVEREMSILITEQNQDGTLVGHNEAYIQVIVSGPDVSQDLLGKLVRVHVTDAKKHCLLAHLVPQPEHNVAKLTKHCSDVAALTNSWSALIVVVLLALSMRLVMFLL